jgi:hypothetical protein
MKTLVTRLNPMAFLLVSGIIIYFNQSLNFDMHHDGLITSNFQEIRTSMQSEGFWPFNQYGFTWIIPFLPIILTGDENSIYERAHYLSLLIYFLTLFISFITAQKFYGNSRAIFVPVILAVTASLGNLRTWPSVSAMLYLSCFLLAAVIYFSQESSLNSMKRASFYMGLMIPLIVFSRVQVGIFLVLVFTITILNFGRIKTRRYYFLAILLTTLSLGLFLAGKNWLGSVLNDTFIFSLNYLSSDESRVVPLFTMIGSLAVFTVFSVLLSNQLPINFGRLITFFVAFGLLVLSALYINTSLTEGPDSITLYIVLMRRLFVSILIGTFLYCVIDQIRGLFNRKANSIDFKDLRMLALVLVAGASSLQLMPLFDSTHAWWASPPLVILLISLINKVLLKYFKIIRSHLFYNTFSLLLIFLLPFAAQIYNLEKMRVTSFGPSFSSGAYSSKLDVSEQQQLSKMVFSIVPSNSKILNLCINSNIFLTTKDYKSASRFYISWPNMRGYSDFIDATRLSEPDFILTCSELLNPPAGTLTEESRSDLRKNQEAIIQKTFPRPSRVGQLLSVRGVDWELWSNEV